MIKKIYYTLTLLLFVFISHQAKAAIGDWKAYMSYHDVQEVEQAGDRKSVV